MAVIDYAGAASARALGVVAMVPAWIALQRYTFPYFTGGPLVISVDTLRATLYPILWMTLAWFLLSPAATRHFLYRRQAWIWRAVLGATYALAIPFIFLTALGLVRTYWLQTPWIADLLLLCLPVVYLVFLMAFSMPGSYARHMVEDREAALDAAIVMSDDSRNRAGDRELTQEIAELGMGAHAFEAEDGLQVQWRDKVLTRQEVQDEERKARRAAHAGRERREIAVRLALAAGVLAIVFAALGVAALSPSVERFMDRYLPAILGTVTVAAYIIGSIIMGARRRSPISNAARILGLAVVAIVLLRYVFLPAADHGIAVVYADFLAEAAASFQSAMDFGK